MIEAAVELARQSKVPKHKMGCVITNRKGNIISTGVNSTTKTHPMQAKYAKRCGCPERIYLHAEIHALVRCREKPHTLYVARIRRSGSTSIAKPCPICFLALTLAGVKKVVYTDKIGISELVI